MRTLCVLVASLFLCGCLGRGCNERETELPDLSNIGQDVQDAGKAIADGADGTAEDVSEARAVVQEVGETIDQQSIVLQQVPEAEASAVVLGKQTKRLSTEVVPKLDDALEKVAEIKVQAAVVEVGGVAVGQAAVDVGKIAKERDQEKARADKLEAQLKSSVHSTLMWLIVIGVVLLAGSVFVAIKVDMKSGIGLAIGSLMLIGASTFVSEYLVYIKWGAVILLLAALGVGGYWLWQYMKDFWQTGNLVEKVKELAPAEKVAEFFAKDGPVRSVVDSGQSKLFHKAVDAGKITKGVIE